MHQNFKFLYLIIIINLKKYNIIINNILKIIKKRFALKPINNSYVKIVYKLNIEKIANLNKH